MENLEQAVIDIVNMPLADVIMLVVHYFAVSTSIFGLINFVLWCITGAVKLFKNISNT